MREPTCRAGVPRGRWAGFDATGEGLASGTWIERAGVRGVFMPPGDGRVRKQKEEWRRHNLSCCSSVADDYGGSVVESGVSAASTTDAVAVPLVA